MTYNMIVLKVTTICFFFYVTEKLIKELKVYILTIVDVSDPLPLYLFSRICFIKKKTKTYLFTDASRSVCICVAFLSLTWTAVRVWLNMEAGLDQLRHRPFGEESLFSVLLPPAEIHQKQLFQSL